MSPPSASSTLSRVSTMRRMAAAFCSSPMSREASRRASMATHRLLDANMPHFFKLPVSEFLILDSRRAATSSRRDGRASDSGAVSSRGATGASATGSFEPPFSEIRRSISCNSSRSVLISASCVSGIGYLLTQSYLKTRRGGRRSSLPFDPGVSGVSLRLHDLQHGVELGVDELGGVPRAEPLAEALVAWVEQCRGDLERDVRRVHIPGVQERGTLQPDQHLVPREVGVHIHVPAVPQDAELVHPVGAADLLRRRTDRRSIGCPDPAEIPLRSEL